MSDQERDPSPVGDYEITDEESEITNHPDNARASDMGMIPEPESPTPGADRGGGDS